MKEIFDRVSVRDFTDQKIAREDVNKILSAGMAGPSAVNSRDYSFIAVTERETLDRMAKANGPAALPLKKAVLAILVCGDLERSFAKEPDFWVVDCAIAAQNMILCATHLGIGSVWLGTWPIKENIRRQKELFDLPDKIVPHSVIAFGYQKGDGCDERHPKRPEKILWEEDRVHREKW